MAQYAVPDSDVSDGDWVDINGFFPPYDLWDLVNNGIEGGTPSQSDGIVYQNNAGSNTCELSLQNLTDPDDNTGHIIRVFANYASFGSETLRVAVFDGATQVDTTDLTINGGSATTYSYTLDSNNVGNNLNDYTDLRVKLTDVNSSELINVYEVELEVPDAGGGGGGGDVEDPTNPEAFLMFL